MTKVTYEGPADELEVDGVLIPRGEETEIDQEVADRLKDYPGVTFSKEETPLPPLRQKE